MQKELFTVGLLAILAGALAIILMKVVNILSIMMCFAGYILVTYSMVCKSKGCDTEEHF